MSGDPKPVQPRRLPLRPAGSSVLWGHLLSKDNTASPLVRNTTSIPASQLTPIAPIDKAGTSLRILLHDTQANLEKFSDRVTKLTGGVDETKREIVLVQKLFEQDHEKLVEDTVDLVNRCQTEIQRSLGTPAQAPKIEELRSDLVAVDRKLEALDKKIDMMHMLNQTQSQALQTLQDQQGKLLASLTPILPLLTAVPLHIENARNKITDNIRDIKCSCSSSVLLQPSSTMQGRALQSEAAHLPSSSPSAGASASSPIFPESNPPPRKKRKLDADPLGQQPGTLLPLSDIRRDPHAIETQKLLALSSPRIRQSPQVMSEQPRTTPISATPRRNMAHKPAQDPFKTPRRAPLTDLLRPNEKAPPVPIGKTDGSMDRVFKTPVRPAGSPVEVSRPAKFQRPFTIAKLTTPARLAPPAPETPKKVDSLASSTSTLSQRSSGAHGAATVSNSALCGSSVITRRLPPQTPSGDSDHSTAACHVTPKAGTEGSPKQASGTHKHPLLDELMTESSFAQPSSRSMTPSGVPSKTMSIKDRRAMLSTPAFRNEGKRFIPLDDDDDGDLLLLQ